MNMLSPNEVRCYKFGSFRLNLVDKELTKNDKVITLTKKSFDILVFLVENVNKTLGKEDFFKNVWANSYVDESNLTQHIYRLRKALEDSESTTDYIETIPKYGYRFNATVERILESSEHSEKQLTETPVISKNEVTLTNSKVETPTYFTQTYSDSSKNSDDFETEIPKQIKPLKTKRFPFLNRNFVIALLIGIFCTVVTIQTYLYFSASPFSFTTSTDLKAVAVFPFKQIGGDNDAKLELGVSDAIISKLGNIENISVIPTETIVSYTKEDFEENHYSLYEIGNKLGADIILTGTIQREGDTARFSVKYYDVKRKRQLCTENYDEAFSNVFNLQDTIAEKAVTKLNLEINEHLNSQEHVKDTENNK